jgi:predicted flap endonuclease-1-like 5' DNA nuclease
MLNHKNDLHPIYDQVIKASERMAEETNPKKKRRYIAEYSQLYDELMRIIGVGEK